jgi:hypothetical protein
MENKAGKHGSAPMLYLTFCLLALILGGCSNKRCNGPKLQSLGAQCIKSRQQTAGEKVTLGDEFYDRLTAQP